RPLGTANITIILLPPKCPELNSRTSGSSCATTGSPTASSNPTTISSTIVVRHGTSSSISLGASCPSDCANGPTGSDQWDLVSIRSNEPHSLALSMVRGFSSRRHDRRDYQPPPLVSEFSPCVLWSIVDRDRFVHGFRARSDSASRRTSGAKSRALASDATHALSNADARHRHWHNRLVPRRRYGLHCAELATICLGGSRARAGRPHDDSGNWLFAAHEFPRLFGAAEGQSGQCEDRRADQSLFLRRGAPGRDANRDHHRHGAIGNGSLR